MAKERNNMKILIWGIGNISRYYMKFDFFSGYEILGFIDSYRKKEIFMNYPVYLPSEITALEYDGIIVCVSRGKDEILQTCIADKLILEKIYFVCAGQGFENAAVEYTDRLMSEEEARHKFPMIFRQEDEQKAQRNYINDRAILEKNLTGQAVIEKLDENHLIVWIPIELLFSEKVEDCYQEEFGEAWLKQNAVWENIPMIAFKPYRSLFLFFMNGSQYPEDYCKWFQNLFLSREKTSGLSDEELVEKRYREYKIMQSQLNKGMQFFIEHPAVAKWNKRGYFNLLDGHHRTAFLYFSGMTKIPVQITALDYEIWCNRDAAHEVHDMILEQQRTEFYQPILNPYFFVINPHREACAKSRLHHILEYFNDKRFTGKKVIDIGANLGFMGQAFYRMGADVTLLEADPVHYELAKKVNKLLYTDCRVMAQRFEECVMKDDYDIAILLTVFYHYYHKEEIRSAFIRQLNDHVSQMIIWESGDEAEQEREFIIRNTKFKNYRHLCYTYATGKFRELGIFFAENSEYL